MSACPEAKFFMAYFRLDGEHEDDSCEEGIEYPRLGEDIRAFFDRCVSTINYDILILYSASSYSLTEVLRIE